MKNKELEKAINKIIPLCYDINTFSGLSSNGYRRRSIRNIIKNYVKKQGRK